MDFQAIAQAKGETLEISKIQLDQGKAKFAAGYVSIPFVWEILGRAGQSCRPPERSPPRFNPRIWIFVKFLRTSASNQWLQEL